MDTLVRAAWTAFWIGLGASAVLIGQPLITETMSGAVVAPAAPDERAPADDPFVVPRSAPLRGPSAMAHDGARRWRVRS